MTTLTDFGIKGASIYVLCEIFPQTLAMQFLFLLLFFSTNCSGQESDVDFAVYFGNDFENDSVTIIANGNLLAKNIKLRATMISPQNLIIIQDKHGLTVIPYRQNKQVQKKNQIKDSILQLRVAMNNTWKNFSFDLKKGRFLYPEYKFLRIGWSTYRVLIIPQSKQGPIML